MADSLYDEKTVGAFSGISRDDIGKSRVPSQDSYEQKTVSMFNSIGNVGDAGKQAESESPYDEKTVGLFQTIPQNRMQNNTTPGVRPNAEDPKRLNATTEQQTMQKSYVEDSKHSNNYTEQQKLLNSFSEPIYNNTPAEMPKKNTKPLLIAGIVFFALMLFACVVAIILQFV